jgi:hypothetical protein
VPGAGSLTMSPNDAVAFVSWNSAIAGGTKNPQNLNRYSYTLNNPVRYTDPTGHLCVGPVAIACVAVFVGAYVLAGGGTIATQSTTAAPPGSLPVDQMVSSVIPDWVEAAPAVATVVADVAPVVLAAGQAVVEQVSGNILQARTGKDKNETDVTRWAKSEAKRLQKDPCTLLEELKKEATQAGDKDYARQIDTAQKIMGCRNRTKRQEKQ